MESRYAVVDLHALAQNFFTIQKKIGNRMVMAVVKANAYGHGIVECAVYLQTQGVDYFGVAFIQEAITLRKHGITIPILVLGGVDIEQIPLFLEYDIEIVASSIAKLQAIELCSLQHQKKAKVHLKIDTGLGRIGVRYDNAQEFILRAINAQGIVVVGMMSHFATSDDSDLSYARMQCERFLQVCQLFIQYGYPMPIRHMANSGAIMQLPESYFDMVRPGIMLYGVYPQSSMKSLIQLEPVLSLYAKIVYFKVVQKGHGVSYGLTWTALQDTRVITLPIGYGDGYARDLSNQGFVLLHEKLYPIIGKICMDQMMVAVGSDTAFCGEVVTLIGRSGHAEITINQLVDWYQGSPYEFLVLLNSRIKRRYHQKQYVYSHDGVAATKSQSI
jgi:alanine racemase